MATNAELKQRLDDLEAKYRLICELVDIKEWLPLSKVAVKEGVSVSILRSQIEEAEQYRLEERRYWLRYGVHYRKVGTPNRKMTWQINLRNYREALKVPPEELTA